MLLIRIIKDFVANRKTKKVLNQAYESEQIVAKLSSTLGTQFYKDWIGRLYAVVNPYIKDGKWDTGQVFEYTEQGIDTTEHAHQWIMQRLGLLQSFIQTNNLFDVLTYEIKRLDNNGNYLFVIEPITQVALKQDLKKLGKWLLWIGLVAAIGTGIFFYIR